MVKVTEVWVCLLQHGRLSRCRGLGYEVMYDVYREHEVENPNRINVVYPPR